LRQPRVHLPQRFEQQASFQVTRWRLPRASERSCSAKLLLLPVDLKNPVRTLFDFFPYEWILRTRLGLRNATFTGGIVDWNSARVAAVTPLIPVTQFII
jgi:hypothetical protein